MRPTGPGQPAHLLLDVVDVLEGLKVPYAAVGAFAASYHGRPRVLEVSGGTLDRGLLEKLTRKYGVREVRTLKALLKESGG
jgi:hypothetical protein